MFQIKICGITSVKDARFASLAGADAIGLNFYDQSPRYLDPAAADAMIPGIPAKVAKVGVFVNAEHDEIDAIAQRLDLDYVQLHGDEPPDFLGHFSSRKVIRAFRLGDDGFTPISAYLQECERLGRRPDALLLDAQRAGEYGGTGQTIDWSAVASHRELLGDLPLVLAGGLTPYNIAEALAAVRPAAVDVASGVESAPGVKDLLLMRAFCSNAQKFFAQQAADGEGA